MLSRNMRKKWAKAGLPSAHWPVRRRGALETGPLVASLRSLRVEGMPRGMPPGGRVDADSLGLGFEG